MWNNDPPTTAAKTRRPPITPPAIAPTVVFAPALGEVLPAPAVIGVETTRLVTTIPAYPAATNEDVTAAIVVELLRLEVRADVLAVALLAL